MPKRIKGETRDFKPWDAEHDNFDSKPRTTPYDSDEGTYAPARFHVKDRVDGVLCWIAPNGVPFMDVDSGTIWDQRQSMKWREKQLDGIAKEGMVGYSDAAPLSQPAVGLQRIMSGPQKGEYKERIKAVTMEEHDLFNV